MSPSILVGTRKGLCEKDEWIEAARHLSAVLSAEANEW